MINELFVILLATLCGASRRKAFEQIAAYQPYTVDLIGNGEPERLAFGIRFRKSVCDPRRHACARSRLHTSRGGGVRSAGCDPERQPVAASFRRRSACDWPGAYGGRPKPNGHRDHAIWVPVSRRI